MKKAEEYTNKELGTEQIDKMQRKSYLNGKGINPNEPFQLDLLFPDTVAERDSERFIPNDYARSSLFTARNKREPRRTLLHEKLGMVQKPHVLVNSRRAEALPEMPWHEGAGNALGRGDRN